MRKELGFQFGLGFAASLVEEPPIAPVTTLIYARITTQKLDNDLTMLGNKNAQLHREVDDLNDQIERLHTDMQKLKDNHARELNRTYEQHQQEMSNLKRILDKAYRWFPSFKRFLNMERECLQYGFNEEQTDKLLHGQAINYSGWLHSNEYRRNALANNVTAQVIRDEKRNLFLHINETPIAQWFKEQFGIGQEQRICHRI